MEKVKAITTYILLLGVSRPTTANLSVVKIDVRQNPTYIRKYGEKLVNFSTCKDFDFFDYEQGPNDFGDCHVTQLEGADTIENIFPGGSCSAFLFLNNNKKLEILHKFLKKIPQKPLSLTVSFSRSYILLPAPRLHGKRQL